jgi:hypothetical protein
MLDEKVGRKMVGRRTAWHRTAGRQDAVRRVQDVRPQGAGRKADG